jgi:hypothetical protein
MRRLENAMSSDLRDVSERWFQAWLDKDAATVEQLAADDYIYIAPSGAKLDRAAILRIIRSPGYRLDRGIRTEVIVRLLGRDAGIVRHRYQGAGSLDGKVFTDDHRGLMVWEKQGGEWRLVMEQNSFSQ